MTPRLLCAGVVVVDVRCGPVDCLPESGGLALLEEMTLEPGGNAANVAAAYARLGGPATLCGCVGDDALGRMVAADLAGAGVDCAGLRNLDGESTASTVVLVDSRGERSFLHRAGANRSLAVAQISDFFDSVQGLVIAGVGLLPALHGGPLAELAHRARERGIVTFLDTVLNPQVELRDAVLPAMGVVDWFVPSAVEAELITGRTDPSDQVRALKQWGARGVVVKHGARGCVGRSPDGTMFEIPAEDVACVDALGAGDAWLAGFARGILDGLRPEDAARCANRAGADCVCGVGARTGLKSWEQVLARTPARTP